MTTAHHTINRESIVVIPSESKLKLESGVTQKSITYPSKFIKIEAIAKTSENSYKSEENVKVWVHFNNDEYDIMYSLFSKALDLFNNGMIDEITIYANIFDYSKYNCRITKINGIQGRFYTNIPIEDKNHVAFFNGRSLSVTFDIKKGDEGAVYESLKEIKEAIFKKVENERKSTLDGWINPRSESKS
ncbi:MAG: hypothetical protein ACP5TL_02985 [Candidatus Micrarchaeia archaeon]